MKRKFQKIISFFLSLLLSLQVLPTVPVAFAAFTDQMFFDESDVVLDCYHSVEYDSEKKVYRLNLELDSELYEHKASSNSSTPERGFFTANYTGDYLIQLWGGDGANGLDDPSSNAKGGTGGSGGYVHGVVHLEAGQTLFYSLGGDGSTTYNTGMGGGANGGGDGGATITFGVGGGGGYSALFLFDKGEFDKYLDENDNLAVSNISEVDRATRYLMIAGGGGGGGAAPGTALLGGNNARWPAHGGKGGTIDESISGLIESSNTTGVTVAGTFYAGFNGSSSGTSDAYIGRGGTTTPGVVSTTVWDWSKGEKPNDWTGSANREAEPGAGGAGNLRGGSGGGGFAGGSGGVQQSLVSPTQVGGGGGGSSFIAAKSKGQSWEHDIVTNLNAEDKLLLDERPADIPGGAVSITFLPLHHDASLDLDAARDIEVEFTTTPYFELVGFDAPKFTPIYTTVTGTGGETVEVFAGYEEVTIEEHNGGYKIALHKSELTGKNPNGINLIPSEDNLTASLELSLEFIPKQNFAGGNNVPLLIADPITVDGNIRTREIKVTTNVSNSNPGTAEVHYFDLHPEDSSVNVPLKLPEGVTPVDHIIYESTDITRESLYTDQYAALRPTLPLAETNGGAYDFIQSISEYSVGDYPSPITQTTKVPVSLTITARPPPDGVGRSKAGEWNTTTTETKNATITFLDPHDSHVNGQTLNFTKEVSYNEDKNLYTYTLAASATTTLQSSLPSPVPIPGLNPDPLEPLYVIPHDGIYLIQVWGGAGGKGDDAGNLTGGSGGTGGYSNTYLKLKANDKLMLMQMGQAGVDSTDNTRGGTAGTATGVKLVRGSDPEIPLVIAGGGGGGGNAVSAIGAREAGGPGANASPDNPAPSKSSNAITSYNGVNGEKASTTLWGFISLSPGQGGDAGANFVYDPSDTDMAPGQLSDSASDALQSMLTVTNPNGRAGFIHISCLEIDQSLHGHLDPSLTDYTIDLTFSDYFSVVVPQNQSLLLMSAPPRPPQNTGNIYSNGADTELILPPVSGEGNEPDPDPGGIYTNGADTELILPPVSGEGNEPDPDPGGIYTNGPDTILLFKAAPKNTISTSPLLNNGFPGISSFGQSVLYTQRDGDVKERITIRDIKPIVTTDPGTGISTMQFSVSFQFEPRTGFLGGNNVPIFSETIISQPMHEVDAEGNLVLDSEGQPIPDPDDVDSQPIKLSREDDFVNVLFTGHQTTSEDLTTEDQYIEPNEATVVPSTLYEWENPYATSPSWEDDYIVPVKTMIQENGTGTNLIDEPQLGPFDKNTHYDVTVGVAPRYTPVLNVQGPQMPSYTVTKEVSVFVVPRLTYSLTHLNTDAVINTVHGCVSLMPGEDHVAILSPESEGYALPPSISVTYDDNQEAVPFSYDSSTGEIFISSQHYDRHMTIRAEALTRKFNITYAYENPDAPGTPITVVHQYSYGDTIVPWEWNGGDITGYNFQWNWYWRPETTDHTTMPAYDLTVVGLYTPKQYTVRVDYYEQTSTGRTFLESHSEVHAFGDSYVIQSPYKSEYISDYPVIRGAVDKATVDTLNGGTEIVHEVTYEHALHNLRVNHILIGLKTDGNTGSLVLTNETTLKIESSTEYASGDSFTVQPLAEYNNGGYTIEYRNITGAT